MGHQCSLEHDTVDVSLLWDFDVVWNMTQLRCHCYYMSTAATYYTCIAVCITVY